MEKEEKVIQASLRLSGDDDVNCRAIQKKFAIRGRNAAIRFALKLAAHAEVTVK